MSKHSFFHARPMVMRPVVRIAVAGAVFLLLAACGNKGPLVMPQKPVPVEVPANAPPATQEPADATQEPADATQPVDGAVKPVGDDRP